MVIRLLDYVRGNDFIAAIFAAFARRAVAAFDGSERKVLAVVVDADRASLFERAFEQFRSQRVLQLVLNYALQRPSPERRIVTAMGELVARLVGDFQAVVALLEQYLSDRHVAHPEHGCALAALGADTPRQAPEVRQVMTRRIKEMADLVERQLPGWGKAGRHEDALGVLSTMLGALIIARAVDEPGLAKDVRAAAKLLIARGVPAKPTAKS